jgi:DNA uptake protein ComE-like DNA-binding protein
MRLSRILITSLFVLTPFLCSSAEKPLLVILEETGQKREGMSVLRVHPDNARIAAKLLQGWSGHMLRLFRYEQNYLHHQGGHEPEPAYLLLSNNQGGFPRYGFSLGNEDKRHAAYVDLHHNSKITGGWGSADQIFSHELGHVLLKQLGPLNLEGGANQVHAIGVRTDPSTALDEGFGEHFQILALDDPDAAPETHALLSDTQVYSQARTRIEEYRHELLARFAPFGRQRMTMLLWFSRMEDVIRYYDVKANGFAREADIPEELLRRDIYSAYLLENILPGATGGRPKSPARMLASEGVVAALLYRWATSPKLQNTYCDDAFYAQFDVTRREIAPAENYFLKLFYAQHRKKPQDAAQLAIAYKELFPDEKAAIDAAIHDIFLEQPLPATGAIWMANNDFKTGTTLFDQFRGAPRTHTFDLNAASTVDLTSVPGMTFGLASAIRNAAPFQKLEDVSAVPGMKAELMNRFRSMHAEMNRMLNNKEKTEDDISIKSILYPYVWRIGYAWLIAGLSGALLYRAVRKGSWWRCGLNGLGAALPALLIGWVKGGILLPLIAPLLIFGVIGTLWKFWRDRSFVPALQVLAAWLAAAVPAAALTRPWC